MQGRWVRDTDDRDALSATLVVWLLYHWGSGSHTELTGPHSGTTVDLSTIGTSRRTHRELVAWFSSPRIAVRTAMRLLETVPNARVWVRRSEDQGAEGPLVDISAEIPWTWSTMVTGQLNGLGVAVMWDPGLDDGAAPTRSAA